MFSIPRVNVIQSDEGFSVEVLGQTGLRYSEDNKTMKIDSEVLNGPAALVVFSRSIKAWSSGDPTDQSQRDRILDNIRRAFQYRGMNIEVR